MMKRKLILLLSFLCATTVVMGGCAHKQKDTSANDSLYQVGLLQSLTAGQYDGLVSVKEFAKHGDIGIGTFDAVNGEMIVLDGKVYQALGDGNVVVAENEETIPFATVTFMDNDINVSEISADSIDDLKMKLDSLVEDNSINQFYMVRLDGTCDEVKVRSELKQNKPYKTLDVALSTDQREFTYSDSEVTIIGLYCPPYMSMLNTPGWHFHYISDDKKQGGHMLEINNFNGTMSVDIFSEFDVYCPQNEMFDSLDLTQDQNERIKEVEQGK